MRNSFALGGGPYHFFVRSSFSAAWSSIDSASSFFSLRFSSSSARRRLASDTSMPPYLAFQLYSVASEMPCLRARSAVFAPASCSRRTAMICSSVNLIRFISPSLLRGRTPNLRGGNTQWRVTGHRPQHGMPTMALLTSSSGPRDRLIHLNAIWRSVFILKQWSRFCDQFSKEVPHVLVAQYFGRAGSADGGDAGSAGC